MKLNKGAMFGLECRVLKKQFGKLFLASMLSADSKEMRRTSGYYKHGAMFGLDARIALAIFGALSVISGAALYSAIQQAKVTALIADINEVEKAATAYLLDTGSNLPFSVSAGVAASGFLAIDHLVNKVHADSNSPYLSYADFNTGATHDYIISHTTSPNELYLVAKVAGTTWSLFTETTNVCKKGSSACSQFVCMWGPSNDIAKAIETQIDATATPGDDNDAGNVRYNKTNKSFCIKSSNFYEPSQSTQS